MNIAKPNHDLCQWQECCKCPHKHADECKSEFTFFYKLFTGLSIQRREE